MNTVGADIVAIESLLAFWAEAGVDACFEDAPHDHTVLPLPAQQTVARVTASVTAIRDGDAIARRAREIASGCESLEALAQAVREGTGDPAAGRRRPVFGRGSPQASVMVIGHGPTQDDEAAGRPFAGAAGLLLDRMLASVGLAEDAWVTNIVFHRPPGDRPANAEDQAAALPFLERAFALIRPRAVLLLGAAPTRTLTGADGAVMKLRGDWRDWRLAEGDVSAPALTTLHPEVLLAQPLAKRAAWADLQMLRDRLAAAL